MAYLVVNQNELYHFKYIKREPDGNGGWRYFYNTGRQRNVSGQGKPIYRRDVAPVARPVSRQDMSTRPRRNAAGNTYTVVSDPSRPYNYASRSSRYSRGTTEDAFKRAVQERDNILKNSKESLYPGANNRVTDALELQNQIINGEGRNMAADKQEADRKRKAAIEAKKPANVAKATVKSISTSVGSVFDKGKNWLSNLFKK